MTSRAPEGYQVWQDAVTLFLEYWPVEHTTAMELVPDPVDPREAEAERETDAVVQQLSSLIASWLERLGVLDEGDRAETARELAEALRPVMQSRVARQIALIAALVLSRWQGLGGAEGGGGAG